MKYESFHNWILENLKPNSTLLEFGSGPGTKRFTEKYTVHSIEHNPDWVGHDQKSKYIYAPIKNGWYDVDILKKKLPPLKYDLILVDGPTGIIGRKGLLINLDLLDTTVTFVFDDVNRPEEMKLMKQISQKINRTYKIFHGVDRHFAIV